MNTQEQAKLVYQFIKNNSGTFVQDAEAAGVSIDDASLTQKVAQECSEEEFVEFITTGELVGAVSLSDNEMDHLKGGDNNFNLCCCTLASAANQAMGNGGGKEGKGKGRKKSGPSSR